MYEPIVAAAPNVPTASNAPAAPAARPVEAAPAGQPGATQQHTEQKPPQPAPASQPNPWLSMLPFILIFVVMIYFMNRSQKKQMQKRQEMMNKIAKGTKVLLTSGIYGVVDAVHDDSMIVEIANGVKVKVAKAGVAGIDDPAEKGKIEGK